MGKWFIDLRRRCEMAKCPSDLRLKSSPSASSTRWRTGTLSAVKVSTVAVGLLCVALLPCAYHCDGKRWSTWPRPWRLLHWTRHARSHPSFDVLTESDRQLCRQTCKLSIVESIPDNVTFTPDGPHWPTTFSAWNRLFDVAIKSIDIAAYKSSLRPKHVIGTEINSSRAFLGQVLFDKLVSLKHSKPAVSIRMVENYPPKDKGDNEDGLSLARRGVLERRPMDYKTIFGKSGAMHSKFMIVDDSHFYMGSANFDWRSLNQKLEIGVLLQDCPCLAKDLKKVFDLYWSLAHAQATGTSEWTTLKSAAVSISHKSPLTIDVDGEPALVYLATSPPNLNAVGRTWDLDAILSVINAAQQFLLINVMDYIPMFLYGNRKIYWPVIDDALRRAVIERKIELKLMCAALHFVPHNLHLLQSLLALDGLAQPGSVQIKIFHVPVATELQSFVARDRRNHKKLLISERTVVIGTSNWSGDYFDSSTGVQIFITSQRNSSAFVASMRQMFLRDWASRYAHPLQLYLRACAPDDAQADPDSHKHVCQPPVRAP